MRTRLAITHAIRQSIAVADKLFTAAGTNSIHRSVGLERYFRDLHVHGQPHLGAAAEFRVRPGHAHGRSAAGVPVYLIGLTQLKAIPSPSGEG